MILSALLNTLNIGYQQYATNAKIIKPNETKIATFINITHETT